jgi:hypothetical protein
MDLMIFLLLGHYVGDFGLQTDHMAKYKSSSPSVLTLHVFVYSVTISIAFLFYWLLEGFSQPPSVNLLITLFIIMFITHWAQDFSKSRMPDSRQLFYLDQSFHMFLLVIYRYIIMG